jgi:cytochrome P450
MQERRVEHGATSSPCPVIGEFDPLVGEQVGDPFPLLARARREAPVFYMPKYDMWCVTRHADVLSIYRDPITYSNVGSHDVLAPVPEELVDRIGKDYVFPLSLGQLNVTDPPQHTRLRKLLQKAFAPKLINALEPELRTLADGLIDEFLDAGHVELISAFASPIPVVATADILGIPRGETGRFRDWVESFFLLTGSTTVDKSEELKRWTDLLELEDFSRQFIRRRRADPSSDLTSHMILATLDDGSPSLTDDEVLANLLGFITAGVDTTAILITHTVYLLLQHRDVWDECCADCTRIPPIVEEVLRLMGPARGVPKTATKEVRLGGVTIPKGATLYVHLGSANRDESVFPEPDSFVPGRDNVNAHLGLGIGSHFCIGAPLARLEARVAIETLVTRIPDLRLVEPNMKLSYVTSMIVPSPRVLDVEWDY